MTAALVPEGRSFFHPQFKLGGGLVVVRKCDVRMELKVVEHRDRIVAMSLGTANIGWTSQKVVECVLNRQIKL